VLDVAILLNVDGTILVQKRRPVESRATATNGSNMTSLKHHPVEFVDDGLYHGREVSAFVLE